MMVLTNPLPPSWETTMKLGQRTANRCPESNPFVSRDPPVSLFTGHIGRHATNLDQGHL